jgi:hypothetical protein
MTGRTIPLLLSTAVILAGGVLHGIGTDRWRQSTAVQTALARLNDLPERVGDWQATPVEMDAMVLRQAGAEGWWLRRFTNKRTGSQVTILLLCGPTRHMAIHQPEDCYRGAGYELAAPAAKLTFPGGHDVFWTARFRKPASMTAANLRICWSWLADGRWRAPENPRFAFAGTSVLYKLYAIRELDDAAVSAASDSTAELLRVLAPELARLLSSSSSTDSVYAHAA